MSDSFGFVIKAETEDADALMAGLGKCGEHLKTAPYVDGVQTYKFGHDGKGVATFVEVYTDSKSFVSKQTDAEFNKLLGEALKFGKIVQFQVFGNPSDEAKTILSMFGGVSLQGQCGWVNGAPK